MLIKVINLVDFQNRINGGLKPINLTLFKLLYIYHFKLMILSINFLNL